MSAEGSWLKLFLQDKYEYYYNIDSKEISWVMPESYLPKESWLMAKEIEVGGLCLMKLYYEQINVITFLFLNHGSKRGKN